MDKHKGSCWCGAVQLNAGEPRFIGNCHCWDCRKACGAVIVSWLGFSLTEIDLKGPIRKISRNPGKERWFCTDCGSPVAFYHTGAKTIGINMAVLEHPENFEPLADVWLQDKVDWVLLADNTQKYQQEPH